MPDKKEWKEGLSTMLEELGGEEMESFKFFLLSEEKHPSRQQLENLRTRVELADKLISFYGFENSVNIVARIMKKIPRNDGPVQNILRKYIGSAKRKIPAKQELTSVAKKRKISPPTEIKPKPHSASKAQTSKLVKSEPLSAGKAGTSKSDHWPPPISLADFKKLNRDDYVKNQSLEVKVIKAFGKFNYKSQKITRTVFYAILADSSDFVAAKVFDLEKKKDFRQGASIAFSNFKCRNGILEVTEYTTLWQLAKNNVQVQKPMREKATKGVPVKEIKKLPLETIISGLYTVKTWTEASSGLFLTITDESDEMGVAIFHQPNGVKPQENEEMAFLCFQVNSYYNRLQLKSTPASFVQKF
nr:PREDICTED: myeloid cell nuclear differentiation antigen-like isoform X2 [Latimeria chalumnae]XP_014349494.1 PREDICTED: myeloid cell nuclear differentiation antigen-like isoform X2 [Latimeria chalumnae]XP_014349495.1 PREDICTED: myeloid cell nuclear differentiation antigen-like isoform X2 [Latimeria chalumnae]|eukprot:XP_014349493.1 PREDICTED: myeloid cell nuclear differentiation antigen-like isoform X2 [Latimeria chalumnae]